MSLFPARTVAPVTVRPGMLKLAGMAEESERASLNVRKSRFNVVEGVALIRVGPVASGSPGSTKTCKVRLE